MKKEVQQEQEETGHEFRFRNKTRTGGDSTRKQKFRISEQLEQGVNFDADVFKKFIEFTSRKRMEELKTRLTQFHGRTYPIMYQPRYQFAQKWEKNGSNEDLAAEEIINTSSPIMQFFLLVLVLSNWLMVWMITVLRVFRGKGQDSSLLDTLGLIGVISRGISILVKTKMELNSDFRLAKIENLVKIYIPELVCLGYSFSILELSIDSIGWLPIEIVIIAYLYSYASKYYQVLRFTELYLRYQHQFKITDIIINLVSMTHLISLLMYVITWANPQTNWASSIDLAHQPDIFKYLYSFYFCTTTILTIGYGDFSPKNKPEIVVVIFMQFFGVIFFGYLITQIGHTLSIMRTKKDQLQRDLMTLNKISKLYRIEKSLANRAKGYLVANREVGTQLNPQDENNFFSKLNEDLRGRILTEKSMSIVKSSIFFLCRWTKQFQKHVADSLQKGLYSPNEYLLQPVGKERIYILKKGKQDVFIERFSPHGSLQRTLRTIQKNDDNIQVSNNLHGYTAVIANKPTKMVAVSRAFTTCYYIDKDSFKNCVFSNPLDIEYYHEIKNKILGYQPFEALEVPSILNIRQHYHPSRTIVYRKYVGMINRFSNKRAPCARSRRAHLRKHHFQSMKKTKAQIQDRLFYCTTEYNIEEPSQQFNDNDSDVRDFSFKRERGRGKVTSTIVSVATLKNDMLTPNQQLNFMFGQFLHHYFDIAIEYRNFFPANNLSHVLRRLQKENYTLKKKKDIDVQAIPRSQDPVHKQIAQSIHDLAQGHQYSITE